MDRAGEILQTRTLFGMELGLERIEAILEVLDNPQRSFASIHVVGTNGKSSTTRFAAAALAAQGAKVGAYLSVGALSLYPTVTYILWAIPLRKGELPKVSEALAQRLGWILNIELVGFALVPLMAVLMARGVGLPA